MAPVFLTLAVTLGIVFLWGLFAPRSQWRALASWSLSDPHANEPGGVSYGIRQALFAVGIVGMLVVAASAYLNYLAGLPSAQKASTPIQEMWGSPDPDIVNRVVVPVGAPPAGFIDQPILGYQEFNEVDGPPDYLLDLDTFDRLGKTEIPGYIGVTPSEGFSAVDTADLLVQLRGGLLCVPREAVIIETPTTVQIAIYYGLPVPTDGSVPDHAASCPAVPPISLSLLVPIDLLEPVGDRVVQALDGSALHKVPVAE